MPQSLGTSQAYIVNIDHGGIQVMTGGEAASVRSCPFCAHANRVGAARCTGCGLPMLAQCPACETVNGIASQCRACGTPLPSRRAVSPYAFATQRSDLHAAMSRRNRLGEITGNLFGFGLAVSALAAGAYWLLWHHEVPVRSTLAAPPAIEVATFAPTDALQPTPLIEFRASGQIAASELTRVRAMHGASTSSAHHPAHKAPANKSAVAHHPPKTKTAPPQRLARADAAAARAATHEVLAHAYCTAAALTRNICLPEGLLTGQ